MSQHWTRRKTRSDSQPRRMEVARFVERGEVDSQPAGEEPVTRHHENVLAEAPSIPVSQPIERPVSRATGIPVCEDIDIPVDQSRRQSEKREEQSCREVVVHSVGTRVARAKSGEKVKVAAYLPPELGARLRRHCFDTNMRISDVIAVALEGHLP